MKRNRDSSVASSSSRISEGLEDQEDLLDNEYGSENENLSGGNCLLKTFLTPRVIDIQRKKSKLRNL